MQPLLVVNSTGVTEFKQHFCIAAGVWVADVSDADAGYRLAPGAVAYGTNLASGNGQASGAMPTQLGGISVTVKDAGRVRLAGLSSNQGRYVVPLGWHSGVATVTVGNRQRTPSSARWGPDYFRPTAGRGWRRRWRCSRRRMACRFRSGFQCGSGCASVPMIWSAAGRWWWSCTVPGSAGGARWRTWRRRSGACRRTSRMRAPQGSTRVC